VNRHGIVETACVAAGQRDDQRRVRVADRVEDDPIAAAKARAGALRAVPSAKTKAAAIKPAVRTAGSPSRLTRLFVIDSPTPFLLAAYWRICQLLL